MATAVTNKEQNNSTMEELLAQYQPLLQIQRGEVVEGTIVDIGKGEILVDIGAKSEGVIPGSEIREERDMVKGLNIGDPLLVYVLSSESESGQIQLSLKKAAQARRWTVLQESLEHEEPLSVKVLDYNKGGLIVDAQKVRGFIPFSHLSSGPSRTASQQEAAEELNALVGQELNVVVIEADPKANRLILSEKKAQQEEDRERKAALMSHYSVGDIVTGTIIKIMAFGLLVELESGLDALVHASEISWDKNSDFAQDFQVGQEIKAKVVSVDDSTSKINLSLKQLTEDPWDSMSAQYKPGQKVVAAVTKITSYGLVLDIDGIDGLLKSDTNLTYKVGDTIQVAIDRIDREGHRLDVTLAE